MTAYTENHANQLNAQCATAKDFISPLQLINMPCDSPVPIKIVRDIRGIIETVPVPCGKCLPCTKRLREQWTFRLKHELKRSNNAHFVTLTYDTDHVPITPKGFMTLDKTDLQKFFKRLRERHKQRTYSTEPNTYLGFKLPPYKSKPIRYYAVGEYGTKNKRPHYHAIIFNADKQDITDSWNLGQIHIGTVTTASLYYTLKYLTKKAKLPYHFDGKHNFTLSSQNLGSNYLTNEIKQYHKRDPNNNYVFHNQLKIAIPRYYRDKIYTREERLALLDHIENQRDITYYNDLFTRRRFNQNFLQYQSSAKLARFAQLSKLNSLTKLD